MKKYVFTSVALNLLWIIWVTTTWKFTHLFNMKSLRNLFVGAKTANGDMLLGAFFNVMNILLLLYTCLIVCYSLSVLFRYHWKWKYRIISFLAVCMSTFLILLLYIIWWVFVPPISESGALEKANAKIGNLDKYEEPQIGRVAQNWIIVYKHKGTGSCSRIIVSRQGMSLTSGCDHTKL